MKKRCIAGWQSIFSLVAEHPAAGADGKEGNTFRPIPSFQLGCRAKVKPATRPQTLDLL